MRIKAAIIFLFFVIVVGGFFYVSNQIDFSHGKADKPVTVTIESGEDAWEVSGKLVEKGVVSKRIFMFIYLWKQDLLHEIKAGSYEFKPRYTIPEIGRIITQGDVQLQRVRVTFPEGWTIKEMAGRLNENSLPGADFEKLALDPPQALLVKYPALAELPDGATLEGYLFPDTYFFAADVSAEEMIGKMLDNFESKFTIAMREKTATQKKWIHDIVTMASIVEDEVPLEEDRAIVSGIFWRRLEIGMMLQSDATVAYVLGGERKAQHNAKDIAIDSPYNTYKFNGLPPGPIGNPGISALNAALNPQKSNYLYFLSNLKTKETVFSVTFEEHVANKAKHGL